MTTTGVVLVAILCAPSAGGNEATMARVNPKTHVPHFTWQTRGKGEKWIYDGKRRVGALNEGPYPVCLHDLRLVPGGPIYIKRGQFMSPFGIAWRMGGQFNMAIDKITVDQKDSQQLKLHFAMHDKGLIDYRDPDYKTWTSAFTTDTWLELTYDAERGSYVFDVRSRLQVRPARVAALAKRVGLFEYQDLLPDECFDRFPPHGKKRFQWFVYTGPDGRLYKLPHTHHIGPDKVIPQFGKDGVLAFVTDRDYNPVVHMLGDTGPRTRGAICFWAWDFHFTLRRSRGDKTYVSTNPNEVHYRIYSEPEPVAKRMLAEATFAPVLEDPRVRCPAYVIGGPNTFEPSDEYRQPSDRWFWQSSHTYCTWDCTTGYESAGCLTIKRTAKTGRSHWTFPNLGHAYAPHPRLKGRYRVRAMVRTKNVKGRVRLGWQFRVPVKGLSGRYDNRPYEYSTAELKGTNDWTELVLETTEAGPAIWAQLYLIQEGPGQSWFDNVEVQPIR